LSSAFFNDHLAKSIVVSKENDLELRKRHLYEMDKEEKERERKREESSRKVGRIRELLDKEERGLCLTCEEEEELEEYEEAQEDSFV
jgi:hypothetical protein